MKNLLKSVIILTAVITFFANYAHAQERVFKLHTFIPAPYGIFSMVKGNTVVGLKVETPELLLTGKTGVNESCTPGTILYDKDNELFRMCTADNIWAMPDLWSYDEKNDIVYLRNTLWNVGIGVSSPLARLHVNGSFLLEGDAAGEDITFPAEGFSGIKFFFHPKKGAIWIGNLDSDHASDWKDDNLGDYSVAMGSNSKASGKAAVAFGEGHQAMGWLSAVIGGWKNTISVQGLRAISLGGKENLILAEGAIIIGGNKIKNEKKDAIVIGYHPSASNFSVTDEKSMVLLSEKIGVNTNPSATFEVEGSIKLGNDKEKGYAPRGGENMYLVSGYVESDGDLAESTTNAVSASRTGLGTYKIRYNSFNFNETPLMTITPVNNAVTTLTNVISISKNEAIVKCTNAATSILKDTNFTFLVIGTLSSTKDGDLNIQAGEQVSFGQ